MRKGVCKITAVFMALSLVLSGCSLSNKDKSVEEASTESTSDTDVATVSGNDSGETASDNSGEASSESSIIFVDDLSEPDLEGVVSDNSSDADSESSTELLTSASEEYPVDEDCIMVFFGDSQIANGQSDGTDIPSLISKRVPYSRSFNLAIGGTTAAIELTTANIQDYSNWTSKCFYGMVLAFEGTVDRNTLLADNPTTLANMNNVDPSEVDFYFIEYGANDFFGKIPLDKYGYDGDIDELHTYYGALCRGIEKLKALSPNAKIILVSPFYGIYNDANGTYIGDSYVTSNGIGTLADYAKKAKNVSESEETYYFDAMFMSKCDLYMDTADQYLMDTVHLSLLGRQVFSRLLAHYPNWIMHYEPYPYLETDFIYIAEFNPDEYYRYRDDMLLEYYPEYYERMMNGEYLLAQPQ